MNWEAWKPLATLIFTSLLKIAGGALVAHGLATNGPGLEALGGAATGAAGAFWSWWVQKGHLAAAEYLKKLTDTATTAAAVAVAKQMAPAAQTGAAQAAHQEVADSTGNPVPKAPESPIIIAPSDIPLRHLVQVLLIAFALSFLVAVPSAQAQVKLTGNVVRDIAAATGRPNPATPGLTGNPLGDIIGALDIKLLPDLTYALKLATASGSKVTGPCYQAWIDIINVRQKAVQDDQTPPQALPMPDPHLVTDFEKLVELRNSLQPDSEFMIKCSPVASMVKKDIVGFIGIVISGGAGLATLVPGL